MRGRLPPPPKASYFNPQGLGDLDDLNEVGVASAVSKAKVQRVI